MDYATLIKHAGHEVDIATYADINVSLECIDCYEVIIDFDKEN